MCGRVRRVVCAVSVRIFELAIASSISRRRYLAFYLISLSSQSESCEKLTNTTIRSNHEPVVTMIQMTSSAIILEAGDARLMGAIIRGEVFQSSCRPRRQYCARHVYYVPVEVREVTFFHRKRSLCYMSRLPNG